MLFNVDQLTSQSNRKLNNHMIMLINLSLLHFAIMSNSSVASPSLLRLAEAMYPAALKTLSTLAEVAGIQWCFKCNLNKVGNESRVVTVAYSL